MARQRDAPELHLLFFAGAIVVGGIVVVILTSEPPGNGPLSPADLLQLEMTVDSKVQRHSAERIQGESLKPKGLVQHEAPPATKKTESFTLERRDDIKEVLDVLDGIRREDYPLPIAPLPIRPPPYLPDKIQLLPSEPDLRMKKGLSGD